jgi:alkylhydroperoxidase family enzyme
MQEPATPKELTPSQRRFVEALLLGITIQGAGAKAGVSERTARYWVKLPAVRAELQRLQGENVERVLRLMSTLGPQAVSVLGRNMNSEAAPNVQVRAALGLLTQLVALSQFHDIEARLQALEAAAEAAAKANNNNNNKT